MKRYFLISRLIMLLSAAFVVTACTTSQDEVILDGTTLDQANQNQDGSSDGSLDGSGVDASGLDQSGNSQATAIADESESAQAMLDRSDSALSSRVIYFDFDSAKISDDSLALLEVHGGFIASNGNVTVRLEGHTDERGSREYNIALSDRRAESVRRILLFQGSAVDQLDTISYGEEQPAESGHNEQSWAKNRRVELVYRVN